MKKILEAKNLNMSYKNNQKIILKDVNLKFEEGDYVAIMGESGSGKSTLLACLAGILKPESGEVIWQDKDLYKLNDLQLSKLHRNTISYVPQSNVFLKEYSILENLLFPYMETGEIEEKHEKKAIELLEALKIKEMRDRFPYELSGGELKRASIARALIMDPEVIVFDEPTTGLDNKTGEIILSFLSYYALKGNLVIIASHDQKVMNYSNRVYTFVRENGGTSSLIAGEIKAKSNQ
jgi:ABC-type lipoprotein export system ATPase subunit